jgi:YfiH family protein
MLAAELTTAPVDAHSARPALAWQLEQKDSIVHFRLPLPLPLTCIFTTRVGGMSRGPFASLNLAHGTGDDPEAVAANLGLVRQALDLPRLVTLKQTHSAEVLYINYDRTPADVLEGDALFTDVPGLALGVKVADCLPVFVFSRTGSVVGLAHAGWRGTRAQVAARLVRSMERKCRVEPRDLGFAFGPCIAADCYVVGSEVIRQFRAGFPAPEEFLRPYPLRLDVEQAGAGYHLDLKAANRQLLRELGLSEVASLDECAHCASRLFYSARRDRTTGRNLALIVRR